MTANPYFSTYSALPRDQLARAEALNAIFDAIIVGFNSIPDATALNQDRLTYCTDTGTAGAYVIAPATPIVSYIAGQRFSFIATHANAGASTVNVSLLGVKTIKRQDGTDLQVNDITVGRLVWVQYDGTVFQLMSMNGSDQVASAASAAAALVSQSAAAASAVSAAAYAASVGTSANVAFGTVTLNHAAIGDGYSVITTLGGNTAIDSVANLRGNLALLTWNAGDGFALLQVASSGTVTLIASSNAIGSDNAFDTTNNVASNGGVGIALVTNAGNAFIQSKAAGWVGTVKIALIRAR